MLASDFGDNAANTWQWSINNGTDYITITDHSVSRFVLPETSADYAADQVRVRQTVDGVVSEHAGLAAFTIDLDAPTADLGNIFGAVIDQGGQTHVITFTESVAGLTVGDFSTSTGIEVTAVSGSGATYTITYTATLADFTLTLTAGGVTDLTAWPVAETSTTGTATAATATNTPPVAEAGDDQDVLTGAAPVTLDGSGTDDDGTIASYAWTQPSGTTVSLSSTTTAAPTFTAPDAATDLVFSLIVTDNDGAVSAADTVTIFVNAPITPPTPPAVYGLRDDPHVTDGDKVVITFTSSHTGDFTIEFDGRASTAFTIDDAAPSPYIHTETVGYDYTGNVSIFLDKGEVSGPAPVTTGPAPIVTAVRNADNSITLTWSHIIGPDYAIYLVENGVNKEFTNADSPFQITGSELDRVDNSDNDQIGVAGVTLAGVYGRTTFTTVPAKNVVADTNQPPVAHAGPNQPNVDTGVLVTLDGSGSNDPDNHA